MEDLEKILSDLGYTNLLDRGNEYRTNAVYRGGDNNSSLCISKTDGRWYDFKERIGGRLEELVKVTLNINSDEAKKILADKNLSSPITTIKKSPDARDKVKIFKKEQLDHLIKDHSYWVNRGISPETIGTFQGGVSLSGKMKNRYIFPIFNKHQQLIGVTGRTFAPEDKRVKWKHIGIKSNWIYPLQFNHDVLTKLKKVVLVESVGDMLSLWNAGIKHTIVLFGLDASISVLNTLIKLNPVEIKISLNNDESQAGNKAAAKLKKRLDKYFSSNQSKVSLPPKNDFGEMSTKQIKDFFSGN
jgi:hypothetical protein